MSIEKMSCDSSISGKTNISNFAPAKMGKTVRIKRSKKVQVEIEPETMNNIPEIDEIEKNVLSHLGNYTEEPFDIIESYFKGQHLERLVRHQIESYNHFVNYQIQRTIQMFNPVKIHSENDYVPDKDKYMLEIDLSFDNFKL